MATLSFISFICAVIEEQTTTLYVKPSTERFGDSAREMGNVNPNTGADK